LLRIEQDSLGRPINPIPLIAPNSLNQLGGRPEDFVALVGQLFSQNLGGGLAFTLPNKNLPTPYSQQWGLTLERELLGSYLISAAYVGTKGAKLTRLTTPNGGPHATAFIPVALSRMGSNIQDFPLVVTASQTGLSRSPQRPIPALGAYQVFENSAASNYHALQLEARKRHTLGYIFTVAYTWSHAIDDVSDIFPIAGAPIVAQNSSKLRLERASANFDIRHHFASSLVWDLPLYRDSTGRLARWLDGWQLASIFRAHSGQPFTLNVPFDANGDGNLTDRPSTTQGLNFLSAHGPLRVTPVDVSEVMKFFILGQDGAVGRNTMVGDSFINLDLAVNKKFRFTDRRSLEFRAEFFNILNRVNFGLPIKTIGDPGFGSAVETVTPARIIQFALKFNF